MKYRKTIIKTIMFITLINLIMCNQVYAVTIDSVFNKAEGFITAGESSTETPIDGTALKNTTSIIYNTLLGAGMLIAIIVGIFIGIKFMVSTVDEKAKIKEVLVPYVCGCIVVFGAFGIWRLVVQILGVI